MLVLKLLFETKHGGKNQKMWGSDLAQDYIQRLTFKPPVKKKRLNLMQKSITCLFVSNAAAHIFLRGIKATAVLVNDRIDKHNKSFRVNMT